MVLLSMYECNVLRSVMNVCVCVWVYKQTYGCIAFDVYFVQIVFTDRFGIELRAYICACEIKLLLLVLCRSCLSLSLLLFFESTTTSMYYFATDISSISVDDIVCRSVVVRIVSLPSNFIIMIVIIMIPV